MTVYCVGNIFLSTDNLPFLLMDKLRDRFPAVDFVEADPNENFFPEDDAIILDTVVGISSVKLFTTLDNFTPAPTVSAHDYDLRLHLQLLIKLGKLKHVRIIGIPQGMHLDAAKAAVGKILTRLVKN